MYITLKFSWIFLSNLNKTELYGEIEIEIQSQFFKNFEMKLNLDSKSWRAILMVSKFLCRIWIDWLVIWLNLNLTILFLKIALTSLSVIYF